MCKNLYTFLEMKYCAWLSEKAIGKKDKKKIQKYKAIFLKRQRCILIKKNNNNKIKLEGMC